MTNPFPQDTLYDQFFKPGLPPTREEKIEADKKREFEDLYTELFNPADTNDPLRGLGFIEFMENQPARIDAKKDHRELAGVDATQQLTSFDPALEDNPAFPYDSGNSEEAQEAYFNTTRAHLDRGINIGEGVKINEMLTIADWATDTFSQMTGLDQVPGIAEEVRELRGAYLSLATRIYGNPSPEEARALNKDQMRFTMNLFERAIQERLANIPEGSIQFGVEGTQQPEPNPERQRLLSDLKFVQEFDGDSASNQAYFLSATQSALRQQAEFGGQREKAEADLLLGMISIPSDSAATEIYSNGHRGVGGPARRIAELFSNYGWLQDQEGNVNPASAEKILTQGYKGTLIRRRLAAMGVPPEVVRMGLPFEALLHFTHPRQAAKLANRLAQHRKISAVEGDVMGPDPKPENPNEPVDFASLVLTQMKGPLTAIQNELSIRDPNAAEATLSAIGGLFQSVSDNWAAGWDNFAKFMQALPEVPEDVARELEGGAIGMGYIRAEQDVLRAAVAADEREIEVTPPSNLREGPDWARRPRDYYIQEVESNRRRLSPFARQRLLPERNFLHGAAMMVMEEQFVDMAVRMRELGFSDEVITARFNQLRAGLNNKEIANALFSGHSREEWQQQLARQKRSRDRLLEADALDKPGRFNEFMKDSVATGIVGMGFFFRSVIEQFADNPGRFLSDASAEVVLGGAAARGTRRLSRRLNAALTMKNMKFAVEELMAQNPRGYQLLRDWGRTNMKKASDETQWRLFKSIAEAADYANTVAKDWVSGLPDPNITRQVYGSITHDTFARIAADTNRLLKKLNPETWGELLDDLKFDDYAKDYLLRAPLLRNVVRFLGRLPGFRVGRKNLTPSFVRDSGGLLSRIIENPDITIEDLPVLPDVAKPEVTSVWRRLFPEKEVELQSASYLHTAADYLANSQKWIQWVRGLNMERWDNLDELIRHRRLALGKQAGNRAFIEEIAPDPELQILERQSIGHFDALDSLQTEVRGRQFDRPIRGLADNPAFEDMTAEDLLAHLHTRYGGQYVYQRLRKAFETKRSFDNRMASLLRRFDTGDEDLIRQHDKVRREIFEEFFEAPGLGARAVFDEVNGVSVTRRRAKLLKKERKALNETPEKYQEFMDDNPDVLQDVIELDQIRRKKLAELKDGELDIEETFGLRTMTDLKEFWDEMKALAKQEKANLAVFGSNGHRKFGNFMQLAQDIGNGNVGWTAKTAKDMKLSMRLSVIAQKHQVESVQRAIERLRPRDRKKLDFALSVEQDFGISAPLAQLRKDARFKDFFDTAAPETTDAAVQRVLNDIDAARQEILHDDYLAGRIDAQEYNTLRGPYATRMYAEHEFPRLIRGVEPQPWAVKARGLPTSFGKIEAQRHPSKFKVLVHGENVGAPIQEIFDELEDAQAFLQEKFGVKGFKEHPERWEGDTSIGNKATILSPSTLEEISPSQAAVLDLIQRIEDGATGQYLQALDQRGMSMTPKEFDIWRQTAEGKNMEGGWTGPLPKGMGALSGKMVRNELMAEIDDYTNAFRLRKAVQGALDHEIKVTNEFARMLIGGKRAVTAFNDATKAGIVLAQIAMSPGVISLNFLHNFGLLQPLATGKSPWLRAQGWADMLAATRDLFNFRFTGQASGIMAEAIEAGALDEVGMLGRATGAKELREEVLLGRFGVREVIGAPLQNVEFRGLLRKQSNLSQAANDPGLSPKKRARIARELSKIEKQLEDKMPDVIGTWAKEANVMRRFMDQPLTRIRAGLKTIQDRIFTIYGDIDNAGRLAAYRELRRQGHSPETAANRLNTFMQNFSRVPRFVKRWGRSFFGSPVVSFPYEMTRIGINVATHRPGAYIGFLAGGLALNMVSLMSTGANPYKVMQYMENELPFGAGAVSMATNFMISDRDGNIASMGIPQFQFIEQMFTGLGALQGNFKVWDNPNSDWVGRVMNFLGTATTSAALTTPGLNAAASMYTARDPVTGDINRNGTGLVGSNLKNLLQIFVPTWTPGLGRGATNLQRTIDSPPRGFGRRRKGVVASLVQTFGGLKVKGDIRTFIPDFLEAPAAKMAKWTSLFLRVETDDSIETMYGTNRNYDWLDLWDGLAQMSAGLDIEDDASGEVKQERYDLRRIREWEAFGTPEQKAAAKKEEPEVIRRLEEKLAVQDRLNSKEFVRKATPMQLLNEEKRARRFWDRETMLDNMGIFRKAQNIGIMAKLGAPREMLDRLVRLFGRTPPTANGGGSNLRETGDPAMLEQAIAGYDAVIANPLPWSDIEVLKKMRRIMTVMLKEARDNFQQKLRRDEKARRAFFELEERGFIER